MRRSLTTQGSRPPAQWEPTGLQSAEGRGGWEPRKVERRQWNSFTGRKRKNAFCKGMEEPRTPAQTEQGPSESSV